MRIWMINHYAVPKTGSSGTRHAVFSDTLRRRGHDVTVFAAALGHAGGAAGSRVPIPAGHRFTDRNYDGVQWRYVKVPDYANTLQRVINMRAFRHSLLRSTEDLKPPEVIIGSTIHPYAADAAWRLARRYQVPFVYEIRDIWPESLADVGALPQWHPFYWHLRSLERKAFRRANGVVVLFPGMQHYVSGYGITESQTCYIPNGVDPCLYETVDAAPTNDFVVSYFGAHGPVNALDSLVEAADILQKHSASANIVIQLVGEGTQKQALMAKASRRCLTNIKFHNPVPKPELAAFAAKSSAFAYCHARMPVVKKYGMSANKLFDYLMSARPIVFACDSFNDPVAEAGAGVSVPPEDPQAMANAILRLRDMSPLERAAMGKRGRAYALQNHNLPHLAERLEQFLENIVHPAQRERFRRAA